MEHELKKFLSDLNVSEESCQKLADAQIRSVTDLLDYDVEGAREIVDDEKVFEIIEKLGNNAMNIVTSKHPINLARKMFSLRKIGDVQCDAGIEETSTTPQQPHQQQQQRNETSETVSSQQRLGDGSLIINETTTTRHGSGSSSISITMNGCNVVNSHIGIGNVTIYSSLSEAQMKEIKSMRRKKVSNPPEVTINGKVYKTNGFRSSEGDVWIDDLNIGNVSAEKIAETRNNEDYYPVESRGRALFINNYEFSPPGESRKGGKSDSEKLPILFKNLGFDVEKHDNKKSKEIYQLLKEFSTSSKNQTASMILVFIGSHGVQINGKDHFSGTDNHKIPFSDVWSLFTKTNCKNLEGKPKLFFNQFCRLNHESRGNNEGINKQQLPLDKEDMLFFHSTSPGNLSYRDTEDGTWFATAICHVFKRFADKEDLMGLLTKVNSHMKYLNMDDCCQLCEFHGQILKKLQFYPGKFD